ncbi:MAG: hypothetical protein AAF205_11465 [Pseudomonadota bacterium]
MRILLPLLIAPSLAACSVAGDIIELPVKAASGMVDVMTESDEEKDAKFVRKMRKACEAWEDDAKKARKQAKKTGAPADIPPPPNGNCES